MSPGLTVQQLQAAIASFNKRLKSKQLEVDALDRIRKQVPSMAAQLFPVSESTTLVPVTASVLSDAVVDYLTAKINWLLIDVQEFTLQIKALESQQSGIILAGQPPRRPQG